MEERKKVATKTTHSFNSYNKGNEFRTQYQIAYQFFKKRSKTMLGVSFDTGILGANFCCYVADMEDKKLIQLLYMTEDEYTNFITGHCIIDKDLFRKEDNQQFNLWRGNNGRI